jgi:hypothetical protein
MKFFKLTLQIRKNRFIKILFILLKIVKKKSHNWLDIFLILLVSL